MIQANSLLLNFQMKSPCYLVTLSLERSDFQTFLKQYVILVPFGALIIIGWWYSLIQMKCQGGNKCALSITVKFNQSTRRFGRISFARLFKLTKHIALLFYLLSPYLLSCMRGSRNVRNNVHINKTMMKFCAHWSTVCEITNSDADGIRTQ